MFSGDNASFHHILLAHHGSRCPRISDLSEPGTQADYDYCGYFDVRNNVYYNWSESGFGSYGGKYAKFNLTNCYYKPEPVLVRDISHIVFFLPIPLPELISMVIM